MINIEGLNKADVLRVLYNNSKPLGLGFLAFEDKEMSLEEAEKELAMGTYFDYFKGRVMKVDLSSDIEFSEWGYDRDNGVGSAQRAVDSLKREK